MATYPGECKRAYLLILSMKGRALHCLVSLGVDQTIQKLMQLIKGECAVWFNKQRLTNQKLESADEYVAVSVSESQIDTVKNYIKKPGSAS